MRVLIDTNIMLDMLMGRQPYFDMADQIIKMCADKKIEGYMAAHSIPNMFYVLRKSMSDENRREALKSFLRLSAKSFLIWRIVFKRNVLCR